MFAVQIVSVFVLGQIPVPEWPPMPDFETPVDYVGWYEQAKREAIESDPKVCSLHEEIRDSLLQSAGGDAEDFGFGGFLHDEEKPKDLRDGPWEPAEHPAWEASYQRNKAVLGRFKQAVLEGACNFPLSFEESGNQDLRLLVSATLPHLKYMRSCAKGLVEGAWRAEGGRVDPAVVIEACEVALRAADQVDRGLYLIPHLTAISMRALAYRQLREALRLEVFSAEDRTAAIKMLEEADREPAPFARFLRGECAAHLDFVQYAADSTRPMINSVGLSNITKAIRLGLDDPAKTAELIREYYEAIEKFAKDERPTSAVREMNRAEERLDENLVTGTLLPAVSGAYAFHVQATCESRAVRLLYEVFVYRDAHGAWPERLQDLPRDVVKRCGTDPWSEERFKYRLVDGEPLLYSVAVNGKDDGCEHDLRWGRRRGGRFADTDYVFWPPQREK